MLSTTLSYIYQSQYREGAAQWRWDGSVGLTLPPRCPPRILLLSWVHADNCVGWRHVLLSRMRSSSFQMTSSFVCQSSIILALLFTDLSVSPLIDVLNIGTLFVLPSIWCIVMSIGTVPHLFWIIDIVSDLDTQYSRRGRERDSLVKCLPFWA